MSLDLKLLKGDFLEPSFPPELSYLSWYFRTPLPKALTIYYLTFGELEARSKSFFLKAFVDNTGHYCSGQRLRYLLKKIKLLLADDREAKEQMNFEKLDIIKSGKWRLPKGIKDE